EGDNIGRVHVHVPANARVWIDGEATRQKGADRDFMTPPLSPGQEFTYKIKAQWNQDGQNRERTQTVRVRPNDVAKVDFTRGNTRAGEEDRRGHFGEVAPGSWRGLLRRWMAIALLSAGGAVESSPPRSTPPLAGWGCRSGSC